MGGAVRDRSPFVTILLLLISFVGISGVEAGSPLELGDRNSPFENKCRKSGDYWQATRWPVQRLVIGGRSYSRDQLLAVTAFSDQDASAYLARQLVATLLNYASGTRKSPDIAKAQAWMVENFIPEGLPYGVDRIEGPGLNAVAIADALHSFNLDSIRCDYRYGFGRGENPVAVTNIAFTCPQPAQIEFKRIGRNLPRKIVLPGDDSDEPTARIEQFIRDHKASFALTDPEQELRFVSIMNIYTGAKPLPFSQNPMQRIRAAYRRTINGYLVYPLIHNYLRLELGPVDQRMGEWVIREVSASYPRLGTLANRAVLSPDEAANKLLALTGEAAVEKPETIVFNFGLGWSGYCENENRLAYKVVVSNNVRDSVSSRLSQTFERFPDLNQHYYVIDVSNGAILSEHRLADLMH